MNKFTLHILFIFLIFLSPFKINIKSSLLSSSPLSTNLFLSSAEAKEHEILFSNPEKQNELKNTNNTLKREFTSGENLVYVTPWNSKGYDVAKETGWKFDYISPVWFNIIKNKKGKLSISGEHDVDKGWINDVRQNSINKIGKAPRIVPRFAIDQSTWTSQDLAKLLIPKDSSSSSLSSSRSTGLAKRLSTAIAQVIERHGFDGLVFEWGYIPVHQVRSGAVGFMTELSSALNPRLRSQDNPKTLVLVTPAPRSHENSEEGPFNIKEMQSPLTPDDFHALSSVVDRFSLMTYDFSNPTKPGPNAPIEWCKSSVEYLLQNSKNKKKDARKILMGLNFYGNHYILPKGGPGPILGDQFVDLVHKHGEESIEWNDVAKEHRLSFTAENGEKHLIYYPSTMSIEERIQLARELGVGISIWEIGQGLDVFYRYF